MVHCPQCGVANLDESNRCRECGSALPPSSAGVRCPMCSHSNPAGRETCERCNARLTPLVAPASSSDLLDSTQGEVPSPLPLPSAPTGEHPGETPPNSGAKEDEGGSDWLQRMRESALSEDLPSTDWSEPEALPAESPDWLSRLESEPAEVPMEDAEPAVPDWLAEITVAKEPPSEDEPIAAPSLGEVPDWLAEIVSVEDVPGEEASAVESEDLDWPAELPPEEEDPAAEGEVPDWLAGLSPEGEEPAVEAAAEGDVPDWLAELTPAEDMPGVEEPVTEGAMESEIPDWLAGLSPEGEELPAEAAAEGDVPDWLAELTPAEDVPVAEEPVTEGAMESEIPDWLAGLSPEGEELPTEAAVEGDVPDWLAELTPADDMPVAEEPRTEGAMESEVPDWLAGLSPEEEEPAVEAAVEGDVPDWLAELTPADDMPVAEEPRTEGAMESEVPDWLAGLSPEGEEPPAEAAVEGDVPDWLAELTPADDMPGAEEPGTEGAMESNVPDWLAGLPAEEEEPAVEATAEGEVPDWLAELTPADDMPVAEEQILRASVEADAPDWLAALASTEEDPGEEVPTPEAAPPDVEIADWLAAMMPVEDAPIAEDAIDAETPDWLAQMIAPGETEAGLPPLVDAETVELLDELALPDEEPLILAPEEVKMPDWLLPVALSQLDNEAPTGDVSPESEQPELVQAEIPAWLAAMRPDVAATPAPIEEERDVETDGLLAGIAGVVQAAAAVTAVSSVTAKPEGIGAEATAARAGLWQELIARSAQPSPRELPRSAEGKKRYRVERWIVYAIVLVAVVVPLVLDIDFTTIFDLDQPLTAEAGVAYDLVNDVATQRAPVLLAFDYGPAYMGELDLQAASLLRHLALRQARIIAMSLTPEGAGLAQRLIDEVLVKEGYQSGQDYVNLGYFPGEAAGIRALRFLPPHFQNQTFDGMDLDEALVFDDGERFEFGDMALVAVLTSDDDNLRWWIEQTTALEGELETDLPLLAGVSAAIEALVRPYYDMESPQIDGLLVGLAGAADYERALDQTDGPAHTRLESQLVGQVAVLALIVIAVLFYGVFRKGESDE